MTINVCRRLGLYTHLLLVVNPNYPITIAPLQTIQEKCFQLLPQMLSKASVSPQEALEVITEAKALL